MNKSLKRNALFLGVIAIMLCLCLVLVGLTVADKTASAEAEFSETGNISIGHITDTHYYAMRLGYINGDPIITDDVNYFYNWVMDKCTKMWLESSMSFDNSLNSFRKQATELKKKGERLGYVVLSGDCAQDGELLGHIDVANKLRKLQNDIRAIQGDDKFQIFVTFGNHDLYNPETYRFDKTGYRETFYFTTRLEAAQIYAGLGYPDMTDEEAAAFYAPLKTPSDNLMSGKYQYVSSKLSSDFDYAWEFVKEGEDKNTQVFSYSGLSDVKHDQITVAKLLADKQINLIDNSAYLSDIRCYSYNALDDESGKDIEKGALTGIMARKDGEFTFINGDCILSCADEGHVLGGQVQYHTQDWLTKNSDWAHPENVTMAGTIHHSAVEHWEMEEEVTTGFIVYNPVETADFLADYGIRYLYTGHQHANDKATYVSSAGNQLIDMEGAANVSVGSQAKITTILRGMAAKGVFAEKTYLNAYPNTEIDPEITSELYNKVFKDDKYGYVARNKVAKYIDDDKKTISDYSRYARRRIYDNVVDNYMDKFLQWGIVDKLGDIVKGLEPFDIGIGRPIDLAEYYQDVVQLAKNLITGINEKVLADYTYGGESERLKSDDMKVFGFLEEIVYRAVDLDISGEGDTVLDVVMDCYMRHSTGEDWNSYAEMIAEKPSYAKAFANMKNGKLVDDLFNILLDEKTGLMFLIKGLSETTFDLTKDISKGFKGTYNSLIIFLGMKDENGAYLTLKDFNLGDLARRLGKISIITNLIDKLGVQIDLANMSIVENINDIVSKYLTDNFKQGLGEYAHDIVYAFGIDGGHKDVLGADNQLLEIAEYRGEGYTYIEKSRPEIVTVGNGKLPSMLTNNFGSNVATTRNFTYFTDRRIPDGEIQYTTDLENHSTIKTKSAKTEIIGTTKPLIDLGIWCQSGYIELARHTVELYDLKPDTTYAYRAGSAKKGYWSDWYTFTTGSADGSFEVLIATDVQSSTKSAYERINAIQNDIVEKMFKNGVSFVINPGDIVDNGRNLSQYRWLYDTNPSFYANYASVVAAGNHDNKNFTLDKASNLITYGGKSENAYTKDYNYMWTHYNYGIDESQVSLTGFYYSFDYGKVHFTVLNTNDIETVKIDGSNVKQLAKDQYDWLVADLNATNADYKVVVMHKSLYSEGSHSYDLDVMGMRAQLTPTFAQCGVNLVIGGHDHVYNETYYLDANGNKVNTNANGKNQIGKEGTLYVTMGCMGEKFYNFVDNKDIITANGTELHKDGHLSDPTFGKLVYNGENLYYYGYQYLREFDADGNISGGKVVDLPKNKFDLAGTVISICIVGVTVLAIVAAVVVSAVKKKKSAKEEPAE